MSYREDSSPGAAADAPKFREAKPSDSEDSDSDSHSSESPESSSESEDENHPAKQRAMIGPVIPPELKNMSTNEVVKPEPEPEENYGPALPPSFAPAAPSVIGPAMPPGFKADQSEVMEEEDDEDMIGPAPHTGDKSEYSGSAAADFERRAQAMRNKLNNPNASEGPVQRETWMLELPEKMKVGIGLQARTFKSSRNTGEVDSAWTETPADKERREKEAREGGGKKRSYDQMNVQSQRDKEMEEQVEILNAKRQKSLYELHQEKMHGKTKKEKKGKDKKKRKDKKSKEKKKEKKKKEKEKKKKEKEKKPERRAFDRDLDLKVNQFDDAMRKHYIKSAQGLGGKFGHSGGGKYL